MKPGLTETAKVQTVTVSGTLVECGGALGESASYVTKFKTAAPVTCGVLSGTEKIVPATSALTIHWSPAEEGASKGSITFPLGEGTLAGLSGLANGGPLSTETTFKTAYTGETFTGGLVVWRQSRQESRQAGQVGGLLGAGPRISASRLTAAAGSTSRSAAAPARRRSGPFGVMSTAQLFAVSPDSEAA